MDNRELDFIIYTEFMGFDDWETDKTYWEKERPPHYSTDIKAAFLVVNKLVEMGYYVDIGVDEHGAQVQLDRFDPSRKIFWETGGSIRGKDASEAICLAALKTKECKDE